MEVTTIVGIVVAVIIMIIGLKLLLKRSTPAEPSLESELHIDSQSNQPIIPRHVRDQLPAQAPEQNERKEPTLQAIPDEQDDPKSASVATEANLAEPASAAPAATQSDVVVLQPLNTESTATTSVTESAVKPETQPEPKEAELKLNPDVATVEIAEFDGESSLLDVHLSQQQQFDDESALATAEQILALNVYPNPRRALSGDKTLKVLLKYGLRFGELSCFHRYEKTDEPSPLMFSVLRMTDNGPAGFDLEALSVEQVQGLAFFLALPHNNALTGFDMMASIAGLVAREIDGKVYDENNNELTPQLKEHWRHHVIDYRSSQASV
ncbi:cell division protein ZipA C-terminal FtsZ-binding domain-containing protein [Acinetobacter soli]|uniref:cell division protein ZipA C-terminal FtsZ-binding domain-containing protein n=1 Tax=Acinetobacter soli TaxID=487316 RepID=UPI001ABCBFAF|nr:cell division protein ZipA C-terminal FtsZ-binding domain-containing protein [Acinetobacter soli]MBO3639016.1 cell division protein ZipA [Acinetobacter soli]